MPSSSGSVANGETIQQQTAEFNIVKKNLISDLQNRCERVVELEISLAEIREKYNNLLRSSSNHAQQKKMVILEGDSEQLTSVMQQMAEQIASLNQDVAIAKRKLVLRNERIQRLESLLRDAQEKLTAANQRSAIQSLSQSLELIMIKIDSRPDSLPLKS